MYSTRDSEALLLQPPSQCLVIIDDPPCSSWIIYRISPLNTHTNHTWTASGEHCKCVVSAQTGWEQRAGQKLTP